MRTGKYCLIFLIFNITITESAEENTYKITENTNNINLFIENITRPYFFKKINNVEYNKEKPDNKIEDIFINLMGRDPEDEKKSIENEDFYKIINKFKESLENIKKKNTTEYSNEKEYSFSNFENNFSIETNVGVMFVGDTHADAENLKRIWFLFDKLKKAKKVDKIVFLGDYGDRGSYWVYTYFLLAAMADYYSQDENNDIIFIRGNHEWSFNDEQELTIQTHFWSKGIIKKKDVKYLKECWEEMFLTGTVRFTPQLENAKEQTIFCSHGAMPFNEGGKLKKSDQNGCFYANWNEILFNCKEEQEITLSRRETGFNIPFFKIYDTMKQNNIDVCIHGHCHENQKLSLPENRQIVTIISSIYLYNDFHFLPSVYIINNEYPQGFFVKIVEDQNEKLKEKKKDDQNMNPKITQKYKENNIEYKYNEKPKEEEKDTQICSNLCESCC